MPLAAEPVNFTWNPSASGCGCLRQRESFTGEFFQKIRETKTTLDRIYLSSLSKPAHLTTVHDYEEWARKSGKKDEIKHRRSKPSPKKSRPSKLSSKCRPLGISDEKIKSALDCSLWEEKKDKICKLSHPLARVQYYDLSDDYLIDKDRAKLDYSRDSAKVYRVMQEDALRQQTNKRLTKSKCGSVFTRRQARQKVRSLFSSNEEETSCEDSPHKNDVEITLEQKRTERNGEMVTTIIDKQKIAFSKIKKSGVVKSDTIDYRLPKLNAAPIKDRTNIPIEKTLKLPQLENCKKMQQEKKKRKKHGEQRKRTPSDKINLTEKSKGVETAMEVISNSETDNIASPKFDVVREKLSEITEVTKKKTHRPKITCKRTPLEDDHLVDYPFLKMGLDTDSESDEECLCDYCLGMTSEVPQTQPKPLKSILSPRQMSSGSARSNKNVSFQRDGLEDVRLITPLAIRNENMKRYAEEERRERLKQQDMKRRQRRVAILARRKKAAYQGLELMAEETSSTTKTDTDCGSQAATRDEDCGKQGNSSEETRVESPDGKLTSDRKDDSAVSELDCSDIDRTSESNGQREVPSDESNDILLSSSPELNKVPALLLDPQEHGRLYEDTVLEEGDGRVTVAELGHRIKKIFNREPVVRDRANKSSPDATRVHADDAEILSKEGEHSESSDDETKGGAFVTKCVVWNETSDSTNTSRSVTPLPQVEKSDLSEFIMSMKDCRYIRWSKSYMDMLEQLGE